MDKTRRARQLVSAPSPDRDKDDFYPTPETAVDRLLTVEGFDGPIWEPACGDGAIVRALVRAGYEVTGTDLNDRGGGVARVDFLMEYQTLAPNIVTNPPFRLAEKFVTHSLALAPRKVAMIARLAFLEGSRRALLFDHSSFARVWVFRRRISMWRGGAISGRFINPDGTTKQAGGMVPFAWFVWDRDHIGKPTIGWI